MAHNHCCTHTLHYTEKAWLDPTIATIFETKNFIPSFPNEKLNNKNEMDLFIYLFIYLLVFVRTPSHTLTHTHTHRERERYECMNEWRHHRWPSKSQRAATHSSRDSAQRAAATPKWTHHRCHCHHCRHRHHHHHHHHNRKKPNAKRSLLLGGGVGHCVQNTHTHTHTCARTQHATINQSSIVNYLHTSYYHSLSSLCCPW